MNGPTLVKEISVLQRFSEQAAARACKPVDFNGFKPKIQKHRGGMWMCSGVHPSGWISHGFGVTPAEAYEEWTYDEIPF